MVDNRRRDQEMMFWAMLLCSYGSVMDLARQTFPAKNIEFFGIIVGGVVVWSGLDVIL
jgi:hypothetical protein